MGELIDMVEIQRQTAEAKRVARLADIENEKRELKINLQAIYGRLSQLEHSEGWLRRASEQTDIDEDEVSPRETWINRLMRWFSKGSDDTTP
tara:strand:+ start:179 stop:454 length:276 start_codon:yes stop_codon:yes gene_type:complete